MSVRETSVTFDFSPPWAMRFAGFFLLSLFLRFVSNYVREGAPVDSGRNALVWTAFSLFIFIPIFAWQKLDSLTFWWKSAFASVLYFFVFLAVYFVAARTVGLTFKVHGEYLFRDGAMTRRGVFNYGGIALLDCVLMVFSLILCSLELPKIFSKGRWDRNQ